MNKPTPDVEQWTAGPDGTGKWAIYVGNEKKKGWSGQGKCWISGLREIDARQIVTAHELSLTQARAPLVEALEAIVERTSENAVVGSIARAAITGTGEKSRKPVGTGDQERI